MTPELKLMLDAMHGDIRETRDRVRNIELDQATREGGDKVKHRLLEAGRWAATVAIGLLAGHVGAGGSH
jgi:hypothetical protein